MYVSGKYKFKSLAYPASRSYVSHSIDIFTVAIKNIRNMHAVSTNQIADIFHFNGKSLKSMENIKSPGNDGLSKEFYKCFWGEVKKLFIASIHKAFLNQELSSSQKQALINLEKKRQIQEIHPISPLNTDTKIISKVLSTRTKTVLPFLISSNQTTYVKNSL